MRFGSGRTTRGGSSVQAQFAFIVTSRLAAAAVQAVVGIGLARSVSPAEYGVVVGFTGIVLLWFIICDLGVSSYTPRARALGDRRAVSTALQLNVATAVAGAMIATAATVFGPLGVELGSVLALIVVGFALDKNIDAAVGIPIADGERLFPAVSVLLRRGTTAAVFFAALAVGVDPVLAYCLATAAGPVTGQVHMRLRLRALGFGRSRWSLSEMRAVVRDSSFFAINDVGNQSRSLDVAIVGVVSSSASAGLFAAASKLLAPFALVAATLATVVLPRAARAQAATIRRGGITLGLASLVMLIAAAPVAYLAEPIITFVLGQDYASASPALAVLVLGLPFTAVASPLDALLQGSGRARFVAMNALVFAVLLLAGVLTGSTVAGATGAAIGVTVIGLAKGVVLLTQVVFGSARR